MLLNLSDEQLSKLKEFLAANADCEQIADDEWVMDLYDTEPAASVDMVFTKEGLRIDGAEYLSYSEEMEGWYMSGWVEDEETLLGIFRNAGAL